MARSRGGLARSFGRALVRWLRRDPAGCVRGGLDHRSIATVLVISFSDLASDPRVDRQIAVLGREHEIVAAGLGPPRVDVRAFVNLSTSQPSKLQHGIDLTRLLRRRYEELFWKRPANVMALERLREVEADLVVANDLRSLAIALRLDAPVVFDAHEYAPDEFGDKLWWRLLVAPHVRWQSRQYIPRVAEMMTVSASIADAYAVDTGVRATVVTNAPSYFDLEPTPVHEPIRILHHGGAQPGRGLEETLQIADLLDDRFTLDLVLTESKPGYRDKLIRRARGKRNVRFPPPRPMNELAQMANEYDIGLFLLPPKNLNQRYVLPNKLFEFIQGRLAVVIGPSPEMAAVVERYKCGVVANDFEPKTLAATINALDPAKITGFKRASSSSARELCAERNGELVLGLVAQALAGATRDSST